MENRILNKKQNKYQVFRVLLWLFEILIVFLFAFILILNITAVQTYITQKFINSIQTKTDTQLSIGSVSIGLPNTVDLKDLYIQDQNKDTLLYLHSLNVNIDFFKLFSRNINVNSLFIENLVTYIQRKPSENNFNFQFFIDAFSNQEPDTSIASSEPWLIQVKDVSVKNVRASFLDAKAEIEARIDLHDFEGTIEEYDLNKKQILLDKFNLKNTSLKIISSKKNNTNKTQIADDKSSHVNENNENVKYITSFLPDWNILLDSFSLDNIDFQFDNFTFPRMAEGFDNNHMQINDINVKIININSFRHGLSYEINSMSFNENCGFSLNKMRAKTQLTEQFVELKDLQFETTHSKISGNAKLSYSTFNDLFANTGNCQALLNLKNTEVNTNEVFLFFDNPDIKIFAGKFRNTKISIVANANGKINDLNIQNLEISVLEKTKLKTHGTLKGLPELSELRFNANVDLLSTIKTDLIQIIDSKLLTSLNIPKSIEVNGKLIGKTDSLLAVFKLNSEYGNLTANTFYQSRINKKDSININFTLKDFLTGVVLGDTLYGKTSFSGEAGLVRIDDNLYYGSASISIEDVQFNSYNYKDILINCLLKGNQYSTTINSADPNINFELSTEINLQDVKKKYSASLDISNLDLQALNFTQKKIAVSTNLNAELSYNGLENSEVNIILLNTNLANNDKVSPIKLFDLKANSSSQGIDVAIISDILDGKVSSNITAGNLKNTFEKAFRKYWGDTIINDLEPGKSLTFMINSHLPKDIIQLVDTNFNELKINKLEGSYMSDNNNLSVILQIPKVSYSGAQLDSLTVSVNGKNDRVQLIIDSDKLSYSNLQIKKIRISERTDHSKIISEISIRDSLESVKYLIANEIEFGKDLYKIKFLPHGIILGGAEWKVNTENLFEIKTKLTDKSQEEFSVQDFIFVNDEKQFGIASEEEKLILRFKNFALQDVLDIVEFQNKSELFRKERKFIKGNLGGDITFPAFPKTKDININLTINDIYILDSLAGNLSLSLKEYNDKWDVDARLTNQENKILLNGSIDHVSESPYLNLNAIIDIKNLNRFERFSFGTLSKMGGKFSGKVNLIGSLQNPEIVGELGFDDAIFKVNSLNFSAKLNHEKILVNNKGFHFENFTIEDVQSKKFIINGDVYTNTWSNMEFDLNLSTKKFQPINSTSSDNSVFFGKLSLGADVKLKGFIKSPEIAANIQIDSITNLTYAFPGSELKLVTSEGIVEFQDYSKATDSSLVKSQGNYLTDSILSHMTGVNLKARLEIDRGVNFTIDIDPKSGDYLTLNGNAKLDISSNGKENPSIVGIYEINSGIYQLSFYDLVKKNFIIKSGSTIAWSGKPMDADMNITAEYVVRTSSVALVANENSSMSEEEKKIFNKRLPYEVKLNIRGQLSNPEINFNITLPSQYLSDNPLVEAKLKQLNTEEMTQQLNKQVFALLVMGSFIAENPMETTGSSTNIASTAARNSVNGILSSQLNNMSGKYISGVDVNFGLTSYEDYSTGSSDVRTEMDIQVSKKLLNDRLTVEAENSFGLSGSKKESTNSTTAQGYGQFAVIYSLTESGEYKLRAYYQNAYDPFDGDISYSGIALIFEKELDRFKLFSKPEKALPTEKNK